MSTTSLQPLPIQGYALFEQGWRNGLPTLPIQPHAISTRTKHTPLPGLPRPAETFELRLEFPGATVLTTFGQSTVDPTLFFSELELHHPQRTTLFLRDFLASRHDPRLDVLRFRTTELTIEDGIAKIVEACLSLLAMELRPMLEGQAWFTAPFDWDDEK